MRHAAVRTRGFMRIEGECGTLQWPDQLIAWLGVTGKSCQPTLKPM